jgi:hypothetical protein
MGKKYASKWDRTINAARDIAESYDTPVTLRQLFYRLIAAQLFTNDQSNYNYLSKLTAEGRRDGTFPELIDTTREIVEPIFFDSPAAAIRWVASFYRVDRLEQAPCSVYLAVEKRGLIEQLSSWFGEPYGIPILPLGGFTSQTFINVVKADVGRREREYGRKAVLLYAGDFDASGVAIDRVFNERTAGCFAEIRRIALNPGQVTEFGLVRQKGKPEDNNTDAFVEQFGDEALFDPRPGHRLMRIKGVLRYVPVQVEMDALDPNDLRRLFTDAITEFLDLTEISDRADDEDADREHLALLADIAERFSTDQLRAIAQGWEDA